MELWQIIKEIEEKDGIKDFYLHCNFVNGAYELNIKFNDEYSGFYVKKDRIIKNRK